MVHVYFWEMSNWSRAIARAPGHHQHFKPIRPVKVDLDELLSEGIHERDLALAPDPETISWRNFSCGWIACTNWPNGSPNTTFIPSANTR